MSDPNPPKSENEPKDDELKNDELEDDELTDEELEDFEDEPMDLLAGLRSVSAPPEIGEAVEDRIRKRSAGKFFGEPGLADRKPLAIVAVVILLLMALVFWMLRDSSTGSIPANQPEKPELAPGAESAMPTP